MVAGEAGKDRRKRPCNQREEEGCGSAGLGCVVVDNRVRELGRKTIYIRLL